MHTSSNRTQRLFRKLVDSNISFPVDVLTFDRDEAGTKTHDFLQLWLQSNRTDIVIFVKPIDSYLWVSIDDERKEAPSARKP